MNVETGEIKPWDEITEAERASGQWVKLPPRDSDGREYGSSFPSHSIITLSKPAVEQITREADQRRNFLKSLAGGSR